MSTSIKFNHSSDGTLSVDDGITPLSDILSIGAINLTSKRNSKTCQLQYATDKEGLEIISEKAEFAADFLNSSVRSIGILLANVNAGDIEHEINSIAWTISGLLDLAIKMSNIQSDIDCALKTVGANNE